MVVIESVPEPVVYQRIRKFAVAHAVPGAGLLQHIRSIGHALGAAGYHHFGVAAFHALRGQRHGAQA